MKKNTYASSGVDIEKGDRFIRYIKNHSSRAVSHEIGQFSGSILLDMEGYRQPVLLQTTDGVGTKILVAQRLGVFHTIGIDLVAMCVNDLIVNGVFPLTFSDYIACGKLEEKRMEAIMEGIIKGCEDAHCVLTGGETAEMPDLYNSKDFDLAGFAIGIGEKEQLLPKFKKINSGDTIFGLPSSGIHSNGLTLARHVLREKEEKLWEELLIPTRIYVKEMKTLLKTGKILSAAHITGGGIEGNLKRVIPSQCDVKINWDWERPRIFKEIQKTGNIQDKEMRKVFNLGIGLACIVHAEHTGFFIEKAKQNDIDIMEIGKVQ